jgi:signal transduction histidine kinase/ActR/RegA family two-component response regulator
MKAAIALIAFFWAVAGGAAAAVEAPAHDGATRLAYAIESRADKTNFVDLERFGATLSGRPNRESLKRLQHVAWIFLNQSEFDRFEYWNGMLARAAARQGDDRYGAMARINELKSRYDRGDSSVISEISRLARTEPDWFARVHAMSVEAMILIDEDQTGPALKRLSEAEALIPAGAADSKAAESTIWETIGIALMLLDDLDGSAHAFQRADFEFADHAYPRPDFDGIYNMAHMAVWLGDAKLARELAAVHHRLAARSDLSHLRVWDQNLCAMVADRFGAPSEVLACLRGLDHRLTGAQFLAPDILPLRAIAEARLGDVAAAGADLDAMHALQASHGFQSAGLERTPQVEAELLLAQGKDREAFERLRTYQQAHAALTARRFNVGVHQLTGVLQTQLETARRDDDLQRRAARAQGWIAILAGLFVLCAVAVLMAQRRGTAQLHAARLKAEMANRSKSDFLANMSHEIRTPLNGVVGVADMLAASDLPKREREMVEIIRGSGQSLERLLSDVLDLARVEAGQMTIEPAPFHAGDLVRSVAGLSRLKADEKGLMLNADIGPELEGWFLGDATRVRQILVNLVSNAVKFTAAGSVTIAASAPRSGWLRFVVADTGVGFDDAEKERLFGRFQQADGSITRRFGGSGLGLAISRQLASLMDGELDCESKPGDGSRFSFAAPFAAAPAQDAGEDLAATLNLAHHCSIRALVADDHATNQTVIRMMLDQFGVEAVTVANGLEAVEAARRERFDLIFMDVQMPVMDGLEATRVIRAEERTEGRRRTPVVILSANALPEHREASLRAGADVHVTKPMTAADLLAALNTVLQDHDEASAVA